MSHSENILYPPRPGTNNETVHFDFYSGDRLSPEAISDVVAFENQLYSLTLDPDQFSTAEAFRIDCEAAGHSFEPIEKIWQRKLNSINLGVGYFLTTKGKAALLEATGVAIKSEATPQSCARELSQLDIHNVDSSVLDKLEAKSVGFEEKQITQAFIENGFSGHGIPAPNILTIFKNPEVIAEKAQGYRDFKTYLKLVMKDLRAADTEEYPALKAKAQITELYKRRLNVLLVGTYVSAYKLLSQQRTSGIEAYSQYNGQLVEALSAFIPSADNAQIANFLQRMDRLTEGVSRSKDGSFTWLSPEAAKLAERGNSGDIESQNIDRGLYADVNPDDLKSAQIDGEMFGDWVSSVLESYGFLSAYQDWDSERESFAPDGKWQVIVNDKFKNLAVNPQQRIVKVPRKTISIARAIPVIDHETTHVIQHENQRVISQLAIMEHIGIDSASVQIESGGIWQETVAREAILGEVDQEINGTSYLQALRVKARGGTFGECAQAYFEDLTIRMPDMDSDKVAAQAINRTRRIFRSGGLEFAQEGPYLTNTQPLNYLEQRLIYENLGERNRKLLLLGGVAVNNFVRLSELGLMDPAAIKIPEKQPWQLLHDRVIKQLTSVS
jgi:hypothetical protein